MPITIRARLRSGWNGFKVTICMVTISIEPFSFLVRRSIYHFERSAPRLKIMNRFAVCTWLYNHMWMVVGLDKIWMRAGRQYS